MTQELLSFIPGGKTCDRFSRLLASLEGSPFWAERKRAWKGEFPDHPDRINSSCFVEKAELLASQPLAHWEPIFAAADCCVTPILRLDEALAHPQITARGMVVDVGGLRQYAPPFKLSAWPWPAATPAPAAGADSEAILSAAGFSAAEISAMRESRVI